MDIEVYTDGGCSGNPGPGAWAYVIRCNQEISCAGGSEHTTNNRMELAAVIRALEKVKQINGPANVRVYTDSLYVKNGITSWIKNWVKNGWKNASKKPVKNKDLWLELLELSGAANLSISWEWVKGHSGNHYNEICDSLVQEQLIKLKAEKRL